MQYYTVKLVAKMGERSSSYHRPVAYNSSYYRPYTLDNNGIPFENCITSN